MLKYILFDLDGTLTDSSEGITKSVQYGLKSIGIEVENLQELHRFIGPPLEYSFQEFYRLDGENIRQAIEKYRERYRSVGMYENTLYPGIAKMLADLKKRGRTLAVASSKPEVFVRQILKHFNITQYFDVIVGSGLDGSLPKKEDVIREALNQLFDGKEPAPEETAMVGDRNFDINGAKPFGIVSIGVEYGFAEPGELKEAKADYIVKTVKELHEFLLRGSEDVDAAKMQEYEAAKAKNDKKQQMEEKKKYSSFRKAVDILFPLFIYFLTYDIAGIVFSFLAGLIGRQIGGSFYQTMLDNPGTVNAVLVGLSLLTAFACVFPMARREFFAEDANRKVNAKQYVLMGIIAVSASLGLNILFTLLGISGMSARYNAVAAKQNAVYFGVGAILYGFLSPLVEETAFRGLVYNRMKQYFPVGIAMTASSVFFGAYHGNLVQGLYGFILGLVIAYLYELSGKWFVPVMIHGIANLCSFGLTWFPGGKDRVFTLVNCVFFLTIAALGLLVIKNLKTIKFFKLDRK